MRFVAGGTWLAVGLLLGCANPTEVVGPYEGSAGSSSSGTSEGTRGESSATNSTGPVAEGSADSDTGMPQTTVVDDTTQGVDPTTTDPSTSTTDTPPESTSSSSTGDMESSSSGDPPPPTCDEVFGAAAGYVLCEFDDMSCTFNVESGGASCNTICGMFMAAPCIDNIDNPGPGEECVYQPTDRTCESTGKGSTICVCAFP